MALKTFVKVSGINNLSDARYCAGMGVDQLGFNVESNHENYSDPKAFKEISEWLSGVDFVAEIESEDTNLNELLTAYPVQAVQVEHLSQIDEAHKTGLKVIYKTDDLADAQNVWNSYQDQIDYVLYIATESVSGLNPSSFPMVIQGDISESNIDELIKNIEPRGIALVGGDEIRPGFKDFDALADILEALEIDDLD